MMPVLEAEESMTALARLSIGTGAASADFRRQQLATWQRDAEITPSTPAKTISADRLQRLSTMGMGLVKVPKRG